MPTQFEKVMAILEGLDRKWADTNYKLDLIAKKVGILPEDDLFGEDPFDEDDYEEDPLRKEVRPREQYVPSETRTHVEVRNLDGDIEMVAWDEIDQRIIDAINAHKEIARRNPDAMMGPWQLYRDPTGMVRISVDQAVLAFLHKQETYQQPVPRSGNIPRDMDVDEVAKEKE